MTYRSSAKGGVQKSEITESGDIFQRQGATVSVPSLRTRQPYRNHSGSKKDEKFV